MQEHLSFVNEATRVFTTTTDKPEVVSESTFAKWFNALKPRVIKSIWPGALVTCRKCEGCGCRVCRDVGKVRLGGSQDQEERLEVAVRILVNARYFCPVEKLPWMDMAIDIYCEKWASIFAENKPPF